MTSRSPRDVKAALKARSRRRSIDELAASGKRHVRVVSGNDVVQLIQAIVDDAVARGPGKLAVRERERIAARAQRQFAQVTKRQAKAEDQLQRQEKSLLAYQRQIQTLKSRETELREELKEARDRERNLTSITAVVRQLAEVQKSHASDLEQRLAATLDQAMQKIGQVMPAAGKRPKMRPVDATDPLLASIFDDDARLTSNRDQLTASERASSRDISDSVRRLRSLRGTKPGSGPQAKPRKKTDKHSRTD